VIRIGVIGYGYWGPNLVRNFSALPEVRVHAIADRDGKRLALAKSIYPSVAVTTDIGTLFSNPDIEAVAIGPQGPARGKARLHREAPHRDR
jgi:predicted dehydrogenase